MSAANCENDLDADRRRLPAATGTSSSSSPTFSRIIPGNWGKVGSGWLARPLQDRVARRGGGGRIHRSLRQRSRAVGTRTRDRGARHDEKPCRTKSSNSGWFRAWVNRSHSRECRVATVCQHGAKCSGGLSHQPPSKTAERRTTRVFATGKEAGSRPDPSPFRNAGGA
jgi:hypothetical protein